MEMVDGKAYQPPPNKRAVSAHTKAKSILANEMVPKKVKEEEKIKSEFFNMSAKKKKPVSEFERHQAVKKYSRKNFLC